jgi:hypothetical protein
MDDEWLGVPTSSEKESPLVRALFELRKSRDRLNQSPRNHSKPASSRAPWQFPPGCGRWRIGRHVMPAGLPLDAYRNTAIFLIVNSALRLWKCLCKVPFKKSVS